MSPVGSTTHLRPRRSVALLVVAGIAMSGALVSAPGAQASQSVSVRATAYPTLRLGSTGSAVRTLQAKLGMQVTGYFGPVTLAAVKSYQARHRIPTTGVVATMTWGMLNRRPASKPTSSSHPTLHRGMTHSSVSTLQQRLKMPVVTGYFGTLTEAYVKALQRAARLPVTGVVDARTWRRVGKVRFPKPTGAVITPAKPTSSSRTRTVARIISIAKSLRGIPYRAGGYSPSQGFNCSSYTQWVYQRAGINLGGAYTVTQYARSRKIKRSEARAGDLIFYYNYANNFIGHVGIYAGGGMFWHAPRTGRVVSLDPIYSDKVLFGRVV